MREAESVLRDSAAERALIGDCLLDRDCAREAVEVLTTSDFVDPENRKAFEEVGRIVASGEVDPGVTGIAVPVFFPFEHSCGSVGVTLPDYRATGETLEILVQKVLNAAGEIRKRVDLTQAPPDAE